MPKPSAADAAQRLRDHLTDVRALRTDARADASLQAWRLALRAFQAQRLERTYADLLVSPRYGPAAAFFLSDLYGAKDVAARDEGVARILPTLVRVMPAAALDTIARAVELDALSERLDLALVGELRRRDPSRAPAITDAAYADAYRAAGTRADRERQIALTGEIGTALDRLAHKPLLGTALRVMEAPARNAGTRCAARLPRARPAGVPAHAGRRRVPPGRRHARAASSTTGSTPGNPARLPLDRWPRPFGLGAETGIPKPPGRGHFSASA